MKTLLFWLQYEESENQFHTEQQLMIAPNKLQIRVIKYRQDLLNPGQPSNAKTSPNVPINSSTLTFTPINRNYRISYPKVKPTNKINCLEYITK